MTDESPRQISVTHVESWTAITRAVDGAKLMRDNYRQILMELREQERDCALAGQNEDARVFMEMAGALTQLVNSLSNIIREHDHAG